MADAPPRGARAAVYLRVSTTEQGQGVETQEQGVRAWCEKHGCVVVATYRDVGVSGAEWTRRPGILELELAARSRPRPWDIVVVRELSRLGRDAMRVPMLLAKLNEQRVTVWESSTGRPVELDGAGVIVVNVLAALAQVERQGNGLRVRVSHATQFADGRVVGGEVYGYDNVRGDRGVRYAINPDEAAVLRDMFRDAAEGKSLRSIVRSLNERRIPSPRAKDGEGAGVWTLSVVHEMLHRERYVGRLVWGETQRRYVDGSRIREPAESEASILRRTDESLRIIDEETWQRVRARDTAGKDTSEKPVDRRARHLLIGFAICAHCSGPIASTRKRHGKNSVIAYTCGRRANAGASVCPASWRRKASDLDNAVLEWIRERVLNAETLHRAVLLARRNLEEPVEMPPRFVELQAEERAVSRSVVNLTQALDVADDVPEIARALQAKSERLRVIRAELATMARASVPVPVGIDLDAIVANAVELLRRNTDGARSILARVLVGKIRVRWNGRGAPLNLGGSGGAAGLLSAEISAGAERVSSASPEGSERSPLCEAFVLVA